MALEGSGIGPRRYVPQSDRAIIRPRSKEGAVGRRKRYGTDPLKRLQNRDLCLCGRVPQPDRAVPVVVPRSQKDAIGRQRHRGQRPAAVVTGETGGIARLKVPQQHRAILSTVDQGGPIAGKRHGGINPAPMLEHGHLPVCGHVPQADRAVPRPRSEGGAVGRRKRYRTDPKRMPFQSRDLCLCGRVPQPDRVIIPPPGRSQQAAIGRERHRMDPVRVPLQRCHLLLRRHVPQPDRAVHEPRCQPRPVR